MGDLDRRLLRAKDVIDRAYGEPLNVRMLAGLVNTSPAHFIRRFKRAFGETPHRYLMTRRIERAKALLRGSDLSVTRICEAVGFTSVGSFSTRFADLVGESPRRYRARCRDDETRQTLRLVPECMLALHTRPARRPRLPVVPARPLASIAPSRTRPAQDGTRAGRSASGWATTSPLRHAISPVQGSGDPPP